MAQASPKLLKLKAVFMVRQGECAAGESRTATGYNKGDIEYLKGPPNIEEENDFKNDDDIGEYNFPEYKTFSGPVNLGGFKQFPGNGDDPGQKQDNMEPGKTPDQRRQSA